ncbi:MAG TPA: alpha/beta fold hydrolase [Vineibacter sp.]|nr:alpha/beta fold hydrolase [Vineibacter sp.]
MRRRQFLRIAAGASLVVPASAVAAESRRFVLVHGAWHGAWCWQRVVPLLQARGHIAEAPTLAGLGERSAELSDSITLDTHVSDVVDLIYARELRDVVLVGHSYAGAVISGVADRVPDRLRRLVFLDAIIIESGQSVGLPAGRDPRRPAAIPPPPASAFGIADPADLAWVQRNLTPHPAGTFEPPLILQHPLGNGVPAVYVACTRPAAMAHAAYQRMALSQRGWQFVELAAGHDAMVTAPGALSDLLERIAA